MPGPVSSISTDSTPAAEATVAADASVVEGPGVPETQTTTGISGSGRSETEVVGTSGRNETEVSGTADSGRQVATDSNVRQESTVAQNDTNRDAGVVSELPATASPLALSGLLGLLSLLGAAGIRSFRL